MGQFKQISVLIVGCGDVGLELARLLLARGWDVSGLRRHIDAVNAPIEWIQADITRAESLAVLRERNFDYVVVATSAGEFSQQRYQQVYVEGLQNVLAALLKSPKRLILVSSTSVYHQQQGEWVDELSATQAAGFAGQAQLDAEALLLASHINSTVVRFAGIYGPGRNRLIQQVIAGEGCSLDPPLYSNRIHRDDAAGLIAYLLDQDCRGVKLESCYLGVDSCPAPLAEVKQWIAGQLGFTKDHLSCSQQNSRRTSKRCSNQRIRDLGYQLIYPDYRSGYLPLLEPFIEKNPR
jgi:nucleoside-diphosphate-sugar epimerase